MAVFVKKPWNEYPAVLPEGTSVRLSGKGTFLFALNLEGREIAKFFAKTVTDYWVEIDGERVTSLGSREERRDVSGGKCRGWQRSVG